MRSTVAAPGALPAGPEWLFEVDWAGVAVTADVRPADEGGTTLCDADGRDVTARFPEFAALGRVLADGLLVGEAVLLDGGSPSAPALAERMRVADARRARSLARARPAVLMVHDVHRLYGVDLAGRTLDDRRAVLDRLDLSGAARVQVSPAYADGAALLRGVAEQGLPGVVARRRDRAAPDVEPRDVVRVAADPTDPRAWVEPVRSGRPARR